MSISMKRYNDTIITPKDDRILFDQIFDDYGLIYGGSATMAASNKIHVGAARGFIKGTEVIIEAEDIAVNLSDSGTKNGRLKIVMDLADTETPIKFESEVAASFPALEQDANINYDNGRYEVVFATYKATETTISSVALVMPTMQSVKAKIQGINQSLTNLKTFPEDGERLIGTAGRYKVYEVSKAVQLNAGFLSFKLCSHNLIQIRSLEAFISSPDNSYIYKANIDNNATVVYKNGTINLNLTSQTSANNIVTVHCVYLAS